MSSGSLGKGSGYLEIGETGTIFDINAEGIISDEHLSPLADPPSRICALSINATRNYPAETLTNAP